MARWRVIYAFSDKMDCGHLYSVGDEYPRTGGVTSDARLAELASYSNFIGQPLISKVSDVDYELPDVTDEDDGKVLTVVDGAWDKADASTEES